MGEKNGDFGCGPAGAGPPVWAQAEQAARVMKSASAVIGVFMDDPLPCRIIGGRDGSIGTEPPRPARGSRSSLLGRSDDSPAEYERNFSKTARTCPDRLGLFPNHRFKRHLRLILALARLTAPRSSRGPSPRAGAGLARRFLLRPGPAVSGAGRGRIRRLHRSLAPRPGLPGPVERR